MRLNISSKIIIPISIIVVSVLSIGFYVIISDKSNELYNEMSRSSNIISRTIQESTSDYLSDIQGGLSHLQALTEHLGGIEGVEWVEVFDRDATIIAHSKKERVGSKPLGIHQSYVNEIFETGKPIDEEDKQRGKFNKFIPVFEISNEEEGVVIGVVGLVMDMELLFKKVAELRIHMILTMVALIAVILIAVFWIIRRVVVLPILKLSDMTNKVSEGHFEGRVKITSTDELGMLGTSFNRMTSQLDIAAEELKCEITEREIILSTLQESEELFRLISTSAKDAIIMIDNESIISFWNKAAEEIFAYSKKDAVGKSLAELIIPENLREAYMTGFEKFKDTGQGTAIGKTVRFTAVRKDGKEFPIELSLSSVNLKGKWCAIGLIRDIAVRKKAERRLSAQHAVTQILSVSDTRKEASSKILQAICESLNWEFGALWFYHRKDDVMRCSELWHVSDTEVSEFNKMTKEISFAPGIGLPGRVFASGKPAWIADVVADPNSPRASIAQKAGLHGAFAFPVVINEKVFGVLEFFSQKKEEPDNDLLNMMSDIGTHIALFIKRTQAEEQTRKLSRAVEQSPSTIVITDTEGMIEYVNPKFSQITGYSFEEAVGNNPRILKSGKQSPAVYKEMWESISSGNEWRGEICNKKKNDDLYWEAVSISPVINNEGIITNYIAVKEDMTERKQLEEQLRISHKMTSIGRLTASVFHEILNPVNIISSHTQLLLMEAEKGSKTEEDLQSIQDEIKRIVNITDDLLTFSRSEGGEVVEVEINGLLENALTLLESKLNVKSIKHILKLENGLPEVMAHGGELRQAFINIFSNAIEAMPNGGTLTITTQCIQKNGLPLVSIRIIDTGCGIAEEDIGKIFEPFFSTRKEIKGVGLGLSSSYTTIDSYGGKLNVESEEGHGTTFIIDLPVKI